MKFTDRSIAKLSLPGEGRKDYFLFDDGMPNLAVRVGVGSKRFVFQARDGNGGQYRQTLGKFPAITVARARKLVRELSGDVAKGHNLREEKTARRAKRDQARADAAFTLGRLIDSWEEAHRPKRQPNYVKWTADGLRRVCARLLDKPAASISAEELEAGWEPLAGQPAAAHIAGVRMRTLFGWAVRTRKLETDPTKRMVLAEKTGSRDRELSGAEARVVWKVAGTLPRPEGAFVRFLMMTGLRLREAAGSRRSELNGDSSELTVSATRMKGKLKHVVPLPPIVRQLLAELPQFGVSDLIFTRNGKRPIADFSALKRRLDEALAGEKLAPWVLHDLRRSLVGWLVRHGVDSLVADKLLAHSRTSKLNAVAAVYNHYDFLKQRAEALQLWADFLAAEEPEAGSSVPLMLPVPQSETTVAPPAATPRVVTLGDFVQATLHKDAVATTPLPVILGDFSQAMAHKDEVAARFICKIVDILTDLKVMHANEQILKNELAPAFKAKHPGNSHREAFLTLAYRAAEWALNDETVLKRSSEVEPKRAKYSGEAHKRRDKAKRARAEAEEARKMGSEEFAGKAEADALRLDREATVWEQMLQASITTEDPRCVEYRSGDASHTSSRARGVALKLRSLNVEIFGSERPECASIYANAATGGTTTRFQRPRRQQGPVAP